MLTFGICFRRQLIFNCSSSLARRSIIRSTYPDISMVKETIAEFVMRYCSKYSDRIAFIDDTRGIQYKYSDFKSIMHSISSSLTKRGVIPGTMTAIIAPNSPEYFMLIAALSSMGCSVTLCNNNYTHSEMAYQLGDSKPSVIFTDQGCLDKVVKAVAATSSVKDIYIIGKKMDGYGSVDELMTDSGSNSLIGQVDIDIDEHIALMPYSSGTTGLPKGVMLTHKNIVSNFRQIEAGFVIPSPENLLLVLPLYHIYATVIITSMGFMSGSTVVVQPKFESIKFLSAIQKYKISLLHVVPPQIIFLITNPEVAKFDLSSIKLAISAAAPLDAHVEKRLIERHKNHHPDFDIYQGYGLTETSPLTHITPNQKRNPNEQGSVGLLCPNMICKVVDVSTRKELGPNETGELLLKGPNVMKGYFGKSTATMEAFEDEWFKTGDIGHYDEDNYFYITDRIKELIKVQSRQVAPAELEAVLLDHPSVNDCAVVGVKDSKYGEVPRAFVVTLGDVDEKSIHDHMAAHLSPYKQLRGGIRFVSEIPKSPSGKILRRLLKDKQ